VPLSQAAAVIGGASYDVNLSEAVSKDGAEDTPQTVIASER